ncbi:hypothetical protein F0L74_17920 [Chitinophaga agrisoli]|uniref:Acetyl xylan esterase domain-containing protein n=1 Tax=Chitinophaga agrisoli TaxID=2607653 RepID=A0A5B2VU33_9BACT|nr:acetylxylan esterase [Chitinophaga agrisoli]KAA2241746.1 hypothetical protein F0L74_17920 [Chitinophaga agrisoli]
MQINKCYIYNYAKIVFCVLFVIGIHPAHAQQQPPAVIDWRADEMLNTYLMQQMHTRYDLRRQQWQQALTSAASLRAYQQQLRTAYRQLLGPWPEKVALEPKITGTLQQNGYHIEKVIYQSLPQHHVTANLYVPAGKGPFPGVLLFCGHEATAKATESYQQTAILLAKQGLVVLMIDPVSQGERHQLTDNAGKPLTRGGTTEHTLLNAAAALIGSSVAAYELWDNERGLDYLLSRKEVDTARIGCLGNSGGGTQTAYFMAYESRIKVAAVCSYITTRERTFELAGPLDGCVQIPNEGKLGLEIADYMHMLAPKPLLVLAGRYDFVDYTGVEIAYREAQQCYKVLGATDRLQLVTVDDGHGISLPKREAAARWFRRWLYKDDRPVQEGTLPVLTAADLNCTTTGELNNSLTGEATLQEHLLQTALALENSRRLFRQTVTGAARIDTIRKLLGIPPSGRSITVAKPASAQHPPLTTRANSIKHPLQVTPVSTIQHPAGQAQTYLLRVVGEPVLPFILLRPQGPVRQVMIALQDQGKKAWLDSTALLQSWLQQGYAVLLPDLRGTGETADRPEFNNTKFYNKEYRNVMSSLHIGRPLIGQRVTDLLSLLDYLQADSAFHQSRITVRASGKMALVALHAAAIDERISHLQADLYLHSFTDMIRHVMEKDQYSDVIPGVLRYYDIPDLLQIVDKRFAFQ